MAERRSRLSGRTFDQRPNAEEHDGRNDESENICLGPFNGDGICHFGSSRRSSRSCEIELRFNDHGVAVLGTLADPDCALVCVRETPQENSGDARTGTSTHGQGRIPARADRGRRGIDETRGMTEGRSRPGIPFQRALAGDGGGYPAPSHRPWTSSQSVKSNPVDVSNLQPVVGLAGVAFAAVGDRPLAPRAIGVCSVRWLRGRILVAPATLCRAVGCRTADDVFAYIDFASSAARMGK